MLLNMDSALPILVLGPFDFNTFLSPLPAAPFHIREASEKRRVSCSALKQPCLVSSLGRFLAPLAPSPGKSCLCPHTARRPQAPALWLVAPGAEPTAASTAACLCFACSQHTGCCWIVFCRMFSKTQQTVATGRAEIKRGAASQPVHSHRRCLGQRAWEGLSSLDQELPRGEQRATGAWLALMWRISSGYWYERESLLLKLEPLTNMTASCDQRLSLVLIWRKTHTWDSLSTTTEKLKWSHKKVEMRSKNAGHSSS